MTSVMPTIRRGISARRHMASNAQVNARGCTALALRGFSVRRLAPDVICKTIDACGERDIPREDQEENEERKQVDARRVASHDDVLLVAVFFKHSRIECRR